VNIHQAQYCWLTAASVFAAFLAMVVINRVSAHAPAQSTALAAKHESKAATDQPGFYCNLKALTPAERGQLDQLIEKLKAARIETKELPDGYAFRLQTNLISITDLADWISKEEKCCPFFDFAIELQRDGGPLWLRLRGREGVKAFMRHEFDIE
jgi:hypothetical protein